MVNVPLRGLPDYLAPKLRILFVGINPGLQSAKVGHHFAGHSNRFWKLLADSGLLPVALSYQEDSRLLEWGYGLTNLILRPTAGVHELRHKEFLDGRSVLFNKIRTYQPRVIAILGLTIAKIILSSSEDHSTAQSRLRKGSMKPGWQGVLLDNIPVFVLPNPSGRNAHYSYRTMCRLFQHLREFIEKKE